MKRSSKCSIKFLNKGKNEKLLAFLNEYRKIVQWFIDRIWTSNNISVYAKQTDIDDCKNITWLSSTAIASAGRQALSIIYNMRKKNNARHYMIKKLKNQQKDYTNIERSLRKESKPNIKDNFTINLDSRFYKIIKIEGHFDFWIKLKNMTTKRSSILIPIKKTKHFNKLNILGKIRNSIKINNDTISFSFEINKRPNINPSKIVGIDIGLNSIVSISDGQQITKDHHGHTLKSITEKLSRKKKGSKAFKKAQRHRQNFINWSINQININDIKEIRIENLKHFGKGRHISRSVSHWAYSTIFGKIERLCEERDVLVHKVSPSYTSQKCSKCGHKSKTNRNGKIFHCTKCKHTDDADINASVNLLEERIVPF